MDKNMKPNNEQLEELEKLEQMIEAAHKEGLLMCMTDAEVNDVEDK